MSRPVRRSTRAAALKKEEDNKTSTIKQEKPVRVKKEVESPKKEKSNGTTQVNRKRDAVESQQQTTRATKKLKTERDSSESPLSSAPSTPPKKKSSTSKKASNTNLQSAKLKKYAQFANISPFPKYNRPEPEECFKALSILESIHGPRERPAELKASNDRAGCGDSPSVLDALVRTILSQNTSNKNSTAAKLSMDKVYGRSDNWAAIMAGGEAKLVDAIRCGGLAQIKSKNILNILAQVHEKYGEYSLDHLHDASTDEAFTTMLNFQGVGPKTASCVVLFCLGRASFAVDTHVFRISKLLGWVPKEADRESAQAHLETKVPDETKYALHVLMVAHGKVCGECKAKKDAGFKCKLRDAFRWKGLKDEEVEEIVKKEEEDEDE